MNMHCPICDAWIGVPSRSCMICRQRYEANKPEGALNDLQVARALYPRIFAGWVKAGKPRMYQSSGGIKWLVPLDVKQKRLLYLGYGRLLWTQKRIAKMYEVALELLALERQLEATARKQFLELELVRRQKLKEQRRADEKREQEAFLKAQANAAKEKEAKRLELLRRKPAKRLLRKARDGEVAARDWLLFLGFTDARLTKQGPDGGIDVFGSRCVVQVKMEAKPTSPHVVQAIFGIGQKQGKQALVFSLSGFTKKAVEFADSADVPLFTFDLQGEPAPANGAAKRLWRSATKS